MKRKTEMYKEHIKSINKEAQCVIHNIRLFNQNHQKVLSESNILKEENNTFSKSFTFYIKERNKKEDYTQKIFKNLLLEYVDKGYEVPDLNVNPKLFACHPLTTKKSHEIQAYYYTRKRPISFDKSNNYITKLLGTTKNLRFQQPAQRGENHRLSIRNIAFIKNFKNLINRNFANENSKITEYNANIAKIALNDDESSNRYSTHSSHNLSLFSPDISKEKKMLTSNHFYCNLRSFNAMIKPKALRKKSIVAELGLIDSNTQEKERNSNSNTNKDNNNDTSNTTAHTPFKEVKLNQLSESIKRLKNVRDCTVRKELSSFSQIFRRSSPQKSHTNKLHQSNLFVRLTNATKQKKISRNEQSRKLDQLFTRTFSTDFKYDYPSFVKEYRDYLLNYKQLTQSDIDSLIPKDFSFAKEFFHFSKTMRAKLQDAALLERCKGILNSQNTLHRSFIKQIKRTDKQINEFTLNYINSFYGLNPYKRKDINDKV